MRGPAPVTRGDLDGFFGLMVDNLLQFLVILALCTGLAGMPPVPSAWPLAWRCLSP